MQGGDPARVMRNVAEKFRIEASGNAMSMPVATVVFACAWADKIH